MQTFLKKGNIIFALLVLSNGLLLAQDDKVRDLGQVVVTASKFETSIEKTGKVIYKITPEDIKNAAGRTVADLLNLLPGINIDGAFGTPGTNLDYNIRGGRNRHTLILIDGLPINDPSSIANDYDLRLLNAQAVEYIEVLKGGASTLYGTGASSGVINIKLKEPTSEVPEVTLSQSIGSFSTSNTNADLQGRSGKFKFLASGNFSTSEGISAAKDNDPNIDFGTDGYYRYAGRTKLGYDFSENFSLGANLSYEKLKSDYDDGAFADADNKFTIRQLSLGLNPQWKYNGGKLQLKYNFNRINRGFESAFPSTSKGKNTQADLTNEWVIANKFKSIIGIQYQGYKFEEADEEPTAHNIDPYFNVFADVTDHLTINAGLRLNINSEYGSNLVYNLNPSYLFNLSEQNSLKVFGSYSTAFVSPSLYQLFSSFYGNTNLEAEETDSQELGLSLYLSEAFTMNAEYFWRTEENAIDFVSQFDGDGNYIGGGYENVPGERKIEGIEIDFEWNILKELSITGNFAKYKFGNPAQFYRIPDQKLGLKTRYSITPQTRVSVNYTRFGKREAAIFSDPYLVTLDAYNLVDLTISHQILDGKLTFSGAINNLLDEDFVGVYGFTTRPANFTIGVTGKF